MAIHIDTSAPLLGVSDLTALVGAVVAAGPYDEAHWLEWKSGLDLTTKLGCFPIAKAILGLANRRVEVAERDCAGYGYVVIGAEPGGVIGIDPIDPAEWVTRVHRYVGDADGPAWTPVLLPTDQKTVLVIAVEPPRPGHRIWTLRTELEGLPQRHRIRSQAREDRAC